MAGVDTSKQAQLMELLKKEVRSLLVAAKEGLTPRQLEQEYMAMIGKPLPLRDLGFQSTLELVANMPEVVRVCPYEKGTFILKAIADETTKAIARLVARQRKSARARKSVAARAYAVSPCNKPQSFPRRGKAPVLPARVKAELQDLLSSSPLLLLDFDKAFFRRFGRAFQYTQYGFLSMFDVLRSVSDIIVVEQTRAGFLLTLKKYLASEKEKEEVLQAVPAVEKPPSQGTQSFRLTAEEKSEPVKAKAVDLGDGVKQFDMKSVLGAKLALRNATIHRQFLEEIHETQGVFRGDAAAQPQDLEQSLLHKLIATLEIPPDAVQDKSLCSLPPLERRCLVGVFVEYIISPSQFYVHICSRETSDKLQDMMFEMRHCYSNKLVSDRYIMPESSVQPGQLCCVTDSEWWYRVIIHRIVNDKEVEVFYPDYGNLKIVQKSWLRFLKWCYLKFPAQAIPCSLAWVKPVEGTWSNAATLLFKELCSSKLLVGIVDEYVNGILYLFLCDTSTQEDVYFHCVLQDGGCAHVCGENVPSQGFEELNPSALYVQPSGKQENAELVEPDNCLQQESLAADSEIATSALGGDELCDQQLHLSTKKEIRDVWPLLDEASIPRTADRDPELAQEDTNKTSTELMAVVKAPHVLGESSLPAVLFKSVEDFYTSFLCSKQPAEISQDDTDQIERFSNKSQLREAVHPSVLLMAMPFILDSRNDKEKMKNKDHPRSLAVGLCAARGLSDQGPSWKLYVPPTTLSAVLAAVRLATSSDYFQWLPSLRKKV